MAENKMPAAEAAVADRADEERNSYEFAFHVLPTVAEGEVPGVFDTLKAHITKHGGELFDEETPERIELAYDIVQGSEGQNRKYHSAYFGWVRFHATSGSIAALTEEIESDQSVLRYLLIRLTKAEEAQPFRFHEARKAAMVTTVEDTEVLSEAKSENAAKTVSDAELNTSLNRLTEDKGEDKKASTDTDETK